MSSEALRAAAASGAASVAVVTAGMMAVALAFALLALPAFVPL